MTTSHTFPIGHGITQEEMASNPYPAFQAMLANEPVSWVPAFNLWMVTRRADVLEILKDAEQYTMEPEGGQINPMEDTFGTMMLSIDGAEHKRLRDAFIEPYRPKHVRAFYTDLITEITDRLVTEISQQKVVDLDKAFSDALAIYTVVMTLGFEVNDLSQFRDWYDAFATAIGNTKMDEAIRRKGKSAYAQFRQVVLAQVDALQKRPNQSVLSQLIHNQANPLSREELVSNVALTFFGGVETTSAMLSNTIWALLKHPHQLAKVQERPSLIPAAIEEALRWESPVQSAMRFPVQDVVIHGVEIKRHEKIYCMLGAANRDPATFAEPDKFDIGRANASKHLSFAYGPHFCFGAPLARLEGVIGLSALFTRLPKLQLHPEFPTAPHGHEFRSTPTLIATTQ